MPIPTQIGERFELISAAPTYQGEPGDIYTVTHLTRTGLFCSVENHPDSTDKRVKRTALVPTTSFFPVVSTDTGFEIGDPALGLCLAVFEFQSSHACKACAVGMLPDSREGSVTDSILEAEARTDVVAYLQEAYDARAQQLEYRHITIEETAELNRQLNRLDVLIAWMREGQG